MESISEFYKETVAELEIVSNRRSSATTIYPVSRFNFLFGSCLAAAFLIKQISLAIFDFLKMAFTCFLNESIKNSFIENARKIPIFLGAIPVGLLGVILPQTVNEKFLGIPSPGLISYRSHV